MRQKRIAQASIFQPATIDHPIGRTLHAISELLDAHPDWLNQVAKDLGACNARAVGREAISVDSVLRCLILKQYRALSYRELEFVLRDSITCQNFARLVPCKTPPRKSALQALIGRIRPTTIEALNVALIAVAQGQKLEQGRRIRIDSTVTHSDILDPRDNRLLRDSVRVLTRLLRKARNLLGSHQVHYHDHRRLAKRRERSVDSTRGENRVAAYRDLVECVKRSVGYAQSVQQVLARRSGVSAQVLLVQMQHFLPLITQVIDQTERRVFAGEKVPADQKIVSLFESHTDIIVKSRRGVAYGHKINLSSGRSGLVLDVVIESGNPADSERLLPMLQRHIDAHGVVPWQVAADAGYASKANLESARKLGVRDMAFHKKAGIKVEAMTSSERVYRDLYRFRAGIEAGVSYLKRCFGLDRCNWHGLQHFKAYVWAGVWAHNLVVLARLQLARASPT